MNPATIPLRVECYAGYRGEQTPRRFYLGDHLHEIREVVDAWLAPDHRYFKVETVEGDLFILRHDIAVDKWEITLFESRSS